MKEADETMFPTHVGMNRNNKREARSRPHVPHTRGDEPEHRPKYITHVHVPHTRGDEPPAEIAEELEINMFPTHVGMNRTSAPRDAVRASCSPHTWG